MRPLCHILKLKFPCLLMGIEGLLRSLKEVTVHRHLREYKGKTIAVDTYVWLHKIIKGMCCNEHLDGHLSDRFIKECLNRIEAIQFLGVNVLMVFDGAPLPSKRNEEEIRKQKRQNCRLKAKELISKGQNDLARRKLAQAYDVSPQVANRLILVLRQRKIPFIVAPYEADAQLAYLSRNGFVDIVLTQDSDLLAYGARCVLYKLDYTTYEGDQINLSTIRENNQPYMHSFTHCMFLNACILSGCDYLSQVRGVGRKSAFQLVSRNKTGLKAIQELRQTVKSIPQNYEEGFRKAFLTFRFQRVYCPKQKKCVMVNNIDIKLYFSQDKTNLQWYEEVLDDDMVEDAIKYEAEGWSFLGRDYEKSLIEKIAMGYINPQTLELYYVPIEKSLKSKFGIKSNREHTYFRCNQQEFSKRTKCHSVQGNQNQVKPENLDQMQSIRLPKYEKKAQILYLEAEEDIPAKLKKSKKRLLLTQTISAAKKKLEISQKSTTTQVPSQHQQTEQDLYSQSY